MPDTSSGQQQSNWNQINALRGRLIASCQADPGEPLFAPEYINALALSAISGGARGLRLEGERNISYVRRHTRLPIIGLIKAGVSDRQSSVYITAGAKDVRLIHKAGADIIALDATGRPRPDGSTLQQLVGIVHQELHRPVWADVATYDEARLALELGVDVVSTTLYGYTQETALPTGAPPGFELLSKICKLSPRPVVLEGRVKAPDEVARAFECGAWAVVVGSAITRPQVITRRFVEAIPCKLNFEEAL